MEGLDDLNDVLNDLASFDLEGYAQQVSQQKSNKPQIQRPSAPSSSNRAGAAVPSQQSTAFVEDLDDLDLDVPDLDSELSAPSKPSTQARGVVGSSGKSAADANAALDFSFAVAPTSTDDSLDIEDLDIDDIEDISVSDADLGIDFQLPPVSVVPAPAPSPAKTAQPSPSRTSSIAPSPSASPRTLVRPPSRAGTGSSSSSSSASPSSSSARSSLAPKPEILDQLEIKKKKDDDENLSRSSFTFKDLAEDSGEWPDPVKVDKPVKQCTDGLEKLVITVVLADKSTKKVMATKDFTCQELLELACSKLHLWQTEFFQLAVTESGDEDRWLDMRKTIEEEGIKTRQEVQLKLRYLKQPKKIIDQASLRLFYLQTKQNIVQGNYPCPEKLAIQLASFQLQLNHGDYSPSRHRIGFLGDAIRDYLPRDVIGSNPTGYLEQRVYNLHKNLSGKSNLEVMEAYLEQSQQIQTYGSTIFTIKEKFGRIKKFAVAEDGIMISTDEDPKKFTFTRFKHLGGWSLTDDGFSIEVTEPKSTLEFTASPRKSSNVIELLSAYYIFLLTADPSELPLIKMVQKPDNLPNPRMFMKPNTALKRRISDRTLSRLEIFKQKYVSESSVLDIFPNSNLLLQVDAALDQDLVLDRIVATNCEIDHKGLKAFTTAIVTALEYLPQEDQFFEENMAITELNLSDNPLIHNDNGPEDLGRLVIIDAWKLKFLILRNIGLTTRAAKLWKPYLSKNKWLEFIDVANNDLKDKGVPAIMKPLKGQEFCNRFDFSNNNLTGQVCYFLAIVLAKNQRISELRIGQNKIDEKGLTDLHQGLLRNKSLSVLDMSKCGLGASGGRLIIKWLESYNSLKELSLSGCNLGSSWGSSFVKILTSGTSALCAVDLEKNSLGTKATKGILDAVKQHSIVRDLNIAENEIDKKGAAVLGECIGSRAIPLRRLIVRDCGISKSSSLFIGQKVSENISIKILDFSGNEIKDVDGARAWAESIRTNQSIEELRLSRCSFIPEGIELIMRGIAVNTSIKKLYLDGNVKIGRAIWAPLQEVFAQNTTLEYISLRNIGVDVPIMTQFFSDPALRSRSLRLMDLLNNPLISRSPEAQDALKRASFSVLF